MRLSFLVFIGCLVVLLNGCANIVPPSGGKKDVTPPKLVRITPADSSLNIRPKKIELEFDEYLQLTDPASQIQLSPLLPTQPVITSLGRRVTITIPDTALLENTTYRLSFGTAIRDLHEGNQYSSKGYTFSTGSFFDSLRIGGRILSGPTGLPDTSVLVMLYSAKENDSAIARHRPLYVVHADNTGKFTFEGLPARPFRLFALRDANNNLTYDGGEEWVAFHDGIITPRSDSIQFFTMRSFKEVVKDTGAAKSGNAKNLSGREGARGAAASFSGPYSVQVDTGDAKRRTQDINKPVTILFAKKVSAFFPEKTFLTYDSSGITVQAGLTAVLDTGRTKAVLSTPWKENFLYTLRLQKGFAKDSAGADLLPGRYSFRTKREEDYGTLRVHLPTKYFGAGYVLQVVNETDTVHQKPVLDTMVLLRYLSPGKYTIRVVEDRNRNGHWDAGRLFEKLQPEIVIPYEAPIMLKAGWDNIIDFEAPPRTKPAMNSALPTNSNRTPAPR